MYGNVPRRVDFQSVSRFQPDPVPGPRCFDLGGDVDRRRVVLSASRVRNGAGRHRWQSIRDVLSAVEPAVDSPPGLAERLDVPGRRRLVRADPARDLRPPRSPRGPGPDARRRHAAGGPAATGHGPIRGRSDRRGDGPAAPAHTRFLECRASPPRCDVLEAAVGGRDQRHDHHRIDLSPGGLAGQSRNLTRLGTGNDLPDRRWSPRRRRCPRAG